jgi:hypothetical protein
MGKVMEELEDWTAIVLGNEWPCNPCGNVTQNDGVGMILLPG